MVVIVETKSELSEGRRFCLRRGQQARVGRTEWADWALPNDIEMADVHFLVACDGNECRLRDLSEGATLLNRKQVNESPLRNGDQIQAGSTTFVVEINGRGVETRAVQSTPVISQTPVTIQKEKELTDSDTSPIVTATTPVADSPAASDEEMLIDETLSTIAGWAELDPDSQSIVDTASSLDTAVAALVSASTPTEPEQPTDSHAPPFPRPSQVKQELLVGALRLLAFAFRTSHGIRWACDCVEQLCGQSMSDEDQSALKTARRWITDDTLDQRRAAMQAAEHAGMRSSAAWSAVAAAWSNGASLENNECETADESDPSDENTIAHHRLAAKAIAGAVTMAGVEGPATEIADRYRQMIDFGKAIAAVSRPISGS